MKKLIIIPMLFLIIFIVTGCDLLSNKQVLECTKSKTEDGVKSNDNIRISYEKDIVKEFEMAFTLEVVNEEEAQMFAFTAAFMENVFMRMDETEEIDVTFNKMDDKITATIKIDCTKLTEEDFKKFEQEFGEVGATIEENKKANEADGYTCTVK